jgi:hypothetical protein
MRPRHSRRLDNEQAKSTVIVTVTVGNNYACDTMMVPYSWTRPDILNLILISKKHQAAGSGSSGACD